ncbi:MAG: acylphosphatase [Methanothrix sp.]|jgi:acylphosphatase|nr:acylphosphatase [Methanothrix sp.]
MKRLIACVSGQVQKGGYRKRVMQTAKAFGLKGIVENLEDGRVRIIVEGEDEKLKWFESAIDIKNTLIQVSTIEKAYFAAGGEFSRFGKVVDEDETDARLDKGVEAIGSMILAVNGVTKAIEKMDLNLSRRMDNIGEKIDTMSGKIDNIGEKIDTMSGKIDNIGEKIDTMSGKIDNIGEKIDTMSGKIDRIDGKMGFMLQKQDDLIVEVKDMNASLNEKMDRVLDKTDVVELKGDMSDVKAALRAKGII